MYKNIKQLLKSAAASVVLALAGVSGTVLAAQPDVVCPTGSHVQGNNCKVVICHRTNSVTNPYTSPDVDISASGANGLGDHFSEHKGPVFDSNTTYPTPHNGDQWGDIIPPVEGVEPGLNWPAGQAIYDNGCKPTTTTTGGTTTTPGSVLGSSTQNQATAPAGAVSAGAGGGAVHYSLASLTGLLGSVVVLLGSAVATAHRKLQ